MDRFNGMNEMDGYQAMNDGQAMDNMQNMDAYQNVGDMQNTADYQNMDVARDLNEYQSMTDVENMDSYQNAGNAQSMDDYSETNESQADEATDVVMSAEEIEREKMRRRRAAMRERRRKARLKRQIIRWSILIGGPLLILILLIALISGIVSLVKGGGDSTEDASTEATTEKIVAQIDEAIVAKKLPETRDEAIEMLKAQAESNASVQAIVDNVAVYPDYVLQHVAANSEMADFAIGYPANISVVFDGEFDVDVPNGQVPLFLQFDTQWGYADYGKDLLATSGSGPTCVSMAYTYLMKNGSKNPIRVGDYAMEAGYLDEQGDTAWALMSEGTVELGLTSEEMAVTQENMTQALSEGKVLICAMLPGDFTKTNSYILIRDYSLGLFYLNDPTSAKRSDVGWDYDRLSSQISNMWAIGKGTGAVSAPEDTTTEGTTESTTTAE